MRDWLTFAAAWLSRRSATFTLATLTALLATCITTTTRASVAPTVTSKPAGLSATAAPLRHTAEDPPRVPHDRANARRLGAPGARSAASTHGPCTADTTTRGRRHPLWMYDADRGVSMYFELDTTGNVRRLHAGEQVGGAGGDFPPDLGGYSYTAFGRNIPATEPGGLPPPKVHGTDYFQRLQWQGRWLYNRSGGLYNFRARFWSPQLGAFLQLDQYQFLSSGGTLWSWPGQNPFRWADPSGRNGEDATAPLRDWLNSMANIPVFGGLFAGPATFGNGVKNRVDGTVKMANDGTFEEGDCQRRQGNLQIALGGEATAAAVGVVVGAAEAVAPLTNAISAGRAPLSKTIAAAGPGKNLSGTAEQAAETARTTQTATDVTFGRNANQVSHAFRHTDAMGLGRGEVRQAISEHLPSVAGAIPADRPLNQVIVVGGQRVQYSAYRLPDGSINVGRIHGVP